MSVTVRATKIPPLREGDRLTRAEFERRYHAMPDLKKAELIEGVVYMGSPVSTRQHGAPHVHIIGWMYFYYISTPGTVASDNGSVRLDDTNEPQPDAMLMTELTPRGKPRIDADGYVEGGPEFVAEVAADRVDTKLKLKQEAFRRNKVKEFLIWRVWEEKLDWFVLRRGRYGKLTPDEDGILRGTVFPGLWLNVSALLRLDGPSVIATLQQGLASAEHAAFVAKLKR